MSEKIPDIGIFCRNGIKRQNGTRPRGSNSRRVEKGVLVDTCWISQHSLVSEKIPDLGSPSSALSHSLLPSLFERGEDRSPQFVSFAYVVSQADVCHAGFWTSGESLELRDEVFETEGLAGGLGVSGFEHHMDDVDMEVIVGWLV